ncbi:hypothetical protein [Microbulbifer sp. ALW1]|uniref:hypothetical protein n=1 Tax=Microbulbifer sp. (strain ALW1) TaxID=1516059 RepID=UPI00135C1E38|nr:hypothetical protein [Microbulbifer sp. ALW1]
MGIHSLSDFTFLPYGDVEFREDRASSNRVDGQSFDQFLLSDAQSHTSSEKDNSISEIESADSLDTRQHVILFSGSIYEEVYSSVQSWPRLLSFATGVDGVSLKFGNSREIGVMSITVTESTSYEKVNSHDVVRLRDFLNPFWGKGNSASGNIVGSSASTIESINARISHAPQATNHSVTTWSNSSLPNRSILFLLMNDMENEDSCYSIFVRNYGETRENSSWLFEMIPSSMLRNAKVHFNGEALDYVR